MHLLPRFLTLLAVSLLALFAVPGTAPAADKYAAIAFSPSTTRSGYSYNQPSRAAAELAAIRYCKARDARVVIWSRNAWCAMARSSRGNAWGAAWGKSKSAAQAAALRSCPSTTGKYIAVTVFSGT